MAVLIAFLQGWTVLFLLLKLVESLTNGALSSTLSRHNIRLHFCFISIHTTYFNSFLETYSRRRKSLLTHWYNLGVLFGLLGLLLSVLLLLSNLSLSLLDLFRPLPPAHPPPPPFYIPRGLPPRTPSSALPPLRHHPRLHHALSIASPRAPAARVPFLHHARRPWFLPAPYWARLSPRDHSAAHAISLATRMSAAPDRWRSPSRRYHPTGFYDVPPPPHGRHRHHHHHHHHHPPPPGGYPGRDPNRPPCRKHRPPQTPWDPFRKGAQQALPAPAIAGPEHSVTIGSPTDADDEAEEKDLLENGEKSSITISWRRRKPLSIDETTDGEDVPQTSARIETNGANSTKSSSSSSARSSSRTDEPQPQSSRNAFLTPLVPGVTVPAGDLWYMIGAVLIAAVVHELGHALAAGMQNAEVSGIGGFVALLLPGAYVQLGGIEDMSTWSQLKVYCAGAWHNLVSAILALVAVGWLPVLMVGFYLCDRGAMVVTVPEHSPLSGHVEPGDIILKLGQFDVTNGGPSFRSAVSNLILSNDSVGFCVPEDLYRNYSHSRSPCCQDKYLQNIDYGERLNHKCFRVEGIENRTSCLDPIAVSVQPTCRRTWECEGYVRPGDMGQVLSRTEENISDEGLRVGTVNRAVAAPVSAGSDGEGESLETDNSGGGEAEKTSCFVPILPMEQQLVDVRVLTVRDGTEVHFFYEGYPQVLGQSVTVSSYVPRIWWIAPHGIIQLLASLDIPNMIERLLQYFSSISLALAILNMAPVFFLDGEKSSGLFLGLFAPKMETTTSIRMRSTLVFSGTVLLVANLVIALLDMEP